MIKGKINNILNVIKSVKDKQMYLFYLIFWVAGRVYIFANNYYNVKIYHSIGLHFDIVCLVSYIIHTVKEARFFWIPFMIHELIGFTTFITTQLNMNNQQNAILWESGHINSAISKLSTNLGTLQDLFTPLYVMIVITLRCRYGYEKNSGV